MTEQVTDTTLTTTLNRMLFSNDQRSVALVYLNQVTRDSDGELLSGYETNEVISVDDPLPATLPAELVPLIQAYLTYLGPAATPAPEPTP